MVKIKQINPVSFKSLSQELQQYIDENRTGSILALVYEKDTMVYCNKFGWKDKENNIPVAFNDIYRIFSMTKPIVSLAALTLYEEGKFDLDDPLSTFIPEFQSMNVLTSFNKETGGYESKLSSNPITIKHLFTHTSGLSYGWYPELPVDMLYSKKFGFTGENRIRSMLETIPMKGSLEEISNQLSELPLIFEPGLNLWYALNHDILGYLIERISGKNLDVFLKERIFDPLEMYDTDFHVPEDKWQRLVKAYTKNKEGNLIEVEGPISDGFKHKPKFLSGGAGLVSTLEDYLKFTLMLMNDGKFNGNQIVSQKSLRLMTSNQLPNGKSMLDMAYIKPEDPEIIKRNEGIGFGLGVAVKMADNITKRGIGSYSWGGALNTMFWNDPANGVIAILLTQFCPEDNNWIVPIDGIIIDQLVYDALESQN